MTTMAKRKGEISINHYAVSIGIGVSQYNALIDWGHSLILNQTGK